MIQCRYALKISVLIIFLYLFILVWPLSAKKKSLFVWMLETKPIWPLLQHIHHNLAPILTIPRWRSLDQKPLSLQKHDIKFLCRFSRMSAIFLVEINSIWRLYQLTNQHQLKNGAFFWNLWVNELLKFLNFSEVPTWPLDLKLLQL